MVYITQLIYVNPGCESIFDEFESLAIPLISKYNGQLLLRTRPGTVIESNIEVPYEIHLVSFKSADDFERFKQDDTRKSFIHLKEQAVRESLLIISNA